MNDDYEVEEEHFKPDLNLSGNLHDLINDEKYPLSPKSSSNRS